MSIVDSYDGVLFDLDGVLYEGSQAVQGAVAAVAELRRRGFALGCVTNNASRSPGTVAEHLRELGMEFQTEQIVSSPTAAVAMISERIQPAETVLVVGSDYLRAVVSEAGYLVTSHAADAPAAVLQGFDPAIDWADLAEAGYAIQAGAQWFATNLDSSIPRDGGIAPGNGALVTAVEYATGTRPLSAGKPEPELFRHAALATGMQKPLVIGDRLDTDIAGGNRAGFGTALVLTGVHGREHLTASQHDDERPDFILETLDELFAPYAS